ncbi:hypothetical protein GYMLUDRAFT_38132 [Collybiopsis luxurians FD-317 M1]|nr:hypothetical protein GYMLUDRAFT_38132 [Collybiopsis luxurians FD-317 M1]
MAENPGLLKPKNILVIGGGSAGLVTLRNLVERGHFDRVELVERRDDVGGIWYQDEPLIPSTMNGMTINKPQWPSPAYPGLVGNVLPRFLSFSEFPFPPTPDHPNQPFPSLVETEQYLRNFAKPYIAKGLIRLNTEVLRVEELPHHEGWKVRIRDWSACESNEGMPLDSEEIWDAVAVCAGYYDKPNWPDTEGLDSARKRGLALHSKWWNGPDGYEGKRAIIIGNANSSNDIATQLAPVAKSPVYRSMRRPTPTWFPHLLDSRIENVGPIKRYILQPSHETEEGTVNEKVTVLLHDGTEIKDIDVVILGTGYCPHPEFVHILPVHVDDVNGTTVPTQTQTQPPPNHQGVNGTTTPPSSAVSIMSYINPVLPQTRRIPFLHRHILYSYNPSLAFIGAILAITPFIVSDVASTWLALAWSGEVKYPEKVEERLEFDKERVREVERMIEEELKESLRRVEEAAAAAAMSEPQDAAACKELKLAPEPPSSFLTYGFLGGGSSNGTNNEEGEGAKGGEAGYANDLRRDIVQVRKGLDVVLPVWDKEMIRARWEMFPTKYEALKWAQTHCV